MKQLIFAIIYYVCILFCLTLAADTFLFNDRIYNYVVYKSDCEYKMPPNYFLATKNGRYLIGTNNSLLGEEYLVSFATAGLDFMPLDINDHPATFADSCAAKGMLEEFLKPKGSGITKVK